MTIEAAKSTKSDKIDQVLDGDGEVPPWERVAAKAAAQEAERAETPAVDFAKLNAESGIAIPEQSAIVPADDEAYAPTGRQYSEFMDFDTEDLHIPRLRLASGQSSEVTDGKARAGQYLLFGQAPVDELELVVIAATPFRDYRVGDDRVQMCKSDDGKIGVGTPGGVCKLCPKAQWGEKNPITGKSKAPECSDGFSYQIFSLTHGELAVYDLSRTGLDAARKVNMSLKMRGYRNFVVRFGTEQRDGPARSKYHVPIIDVRPITKEERELVDSSVFS